MIICKQSARQLHADQLDGEQLARDCEIAGRNCYASQNRMTQDSYRDFVATLIRKGHGVPLEFGDLTFEVTTSRAVMAEQTRHRQASFCVESQRYIQEARTGDITFVLPSWSEPASDSRGMMVWVQSMENAEIAYKEMIAEGMTPQQAREVLPNSTACRIVMKANLREWRHIFALRCSKAAYPAMQQQAKDMLQQAHAAVPVVFDDLYEQFIEQKGA